MPTSLPNILYILTDDMGYGDLSCLNERCAWETSHLDRLAREGMSFRDAHSSSAVCTPSRYSILTGRYNWRSWLKLGVLGGYNRSLIEPGRMTVASYLRDQGYSTACFGKWHLGLDWTLKSDDPEDVDYSQPFVGGPCDHGFETFLGINGSLDMPPYVYLRNNKVEEAPNRIDPGCDEDKVCFHESKLMWRPGPIAPNFRHEETLGRFTDECLDFIDQAAQREKPFFVYYPMTAPHTPIMPTTEFQGASGTTAYGDFCLQVDAEVGRLLEQIDRLDIADNTIVIFTSDNGCSPRADFRELAMFGHNPSYIFRGHKADIYEGGHRIPLLIRWPQGIEAGGISDETVCLTDLLATCADLLGDPLPNNAGEDSVSNLLLWRGEKPVKSLREATVHHSLDGSFSIRKGPWKLECCPGSGGWSYPHPTRDDVSGLPPMQLYNLEDDIRERRNRYHEEAGIAAELIDLLARYVDEGRSTPGAPQENYIDNEYDWKQLWWKDPV